MADKFEKDVLDFFKKAKKVAEDVTKDVSQVAKDVHREVSKEWKNSDAKKFLDEQGVTDAANKITVEASKQLDTLSGKKIMALMEKRLEIQSEYNDIIATKLEEALNRIEKLEKKNKK